MEAAHRTGSARTEGYYKLDIKEKKRHKVSVELAQVFI